MSSGWYILLKIIHLALVIVWLGGLTFITVVNYRLATADAGVLRVLARQTELFGKITLGPVAGLALLAGLGLMFMLHAGMTPWMGWGLLVWLASIIFGATLLRRANLALAALAVEPAPDPARLALVRRRLLLLNTINLLLLLSAVIVMVWKPGS